MQEEHEAEMAEMSGDMMMHDEPNAFVLEAGDLGGVGQHDIEHLAIRAG
jgi:hypothetical protein